MDFNPCGEWLTTGDLRSIGRCRKGHTCPRCTRIAELERHLEESQNLVEQGANVVKEQLIKIAAAREVLDKVEGMLFNGRLTGTNIAIVRYIREKLGWGKGPYPNALGKYEVLPAEPGEDAP